VGDQLARSLLSGEIGDGDEVVVDVDQARDALSVKRNQGSERAEVAR
jgi:ATP-dependent Clp protease ATP-binding subunit ClpB